MKIQAWHTGRAVQFAFSCALAGTLAAMLTALSGCNATRPPHLAHGVAPGLREDGPARPGANPNAPFMVVDHTAHLVKRPALLDINAAEPCQAANLSLFESGAHIDGGRRSVRLNLVNHGSQACRLGGYPAISLLCVDGRLLGSVVIEKITATTLEAAMRTRGAPATATPSPNVLLAPAGEAAFEVGWSSQQNGTPCQQVSAIAVAAPGTTQSFTVKHPLHVCEGRIQVTALGDAAQL